jgi:hypothetical protein
MITQTVTQTITDTTTITTLLQTAVLVGSQPVGTSPNMYDEQGDGPVTTVVTLTIPHLRILSRPLIAGAAGAGGPVPTTVLDLNRVASSQSTGSHAQSTSSEETTTYTITRTVIQTISKSI